MIGRGRDLSEKREKITLQVKGSPDERLDRYVGSSFTWKSRTRIQELIRTGRIKVNGEPAKPSRKVKRGDEVTLELSPGALPPSSSQAAPDLLYEDPWVMVVNKPPGLLVHPVGRHVYDTLINQLHWKCRDETREDGEPVRPCLCHRIDKDTTGVVVVAKDPYCHREIQQQFEYRLVSKEYIALVEGHYPREDDALTVPMGEGRCLRTCLEHDVLKASRTGVRVLRRWNGYTLLACVPHTGRQNQIRVHLAAAGFPIAGDERYGSRASPEGFPGRYLLHSRAIGFYHPRLKSRVELEAPLPADFQALLEIL
jgi:23S rRNA pseudouridine1911/1915/1917 synthase